MSQHRRTSSESGLFQTRALEKQLRSAAWDGRLKDVQRLLTLGTDVNSGDEYGRCALHLAAYHGIEPVVSALITAGASIDARDKANDTPLHYAAHEGRVNVAKLLVAAGATVSATDKDGKSPIDWAKARNHHSIVELLMDALAGGAADANGDKSAAAAAVAAPKAAWGAEPATANGGAGMSTPQARGLLAGVSPPSGGAADEDGVFNALHKAAKAGDITEIESLVAGGYRVDSVDDVGWTPLFFAVWRSHDEAVRVLLRVGANKNHVSKSGNTALHVAAGKGFDSICQLLIAEQCRCDIKNSDRETAMDCARKNNHFLLVAIIEEAMTKEADLARRTPSFLLREAAQQNNVPELEKQLKLGADINGRDDIGRTALMCAAFSGSEEAAVFLLEAGASKNTTDNYGATSLIWCAHGGSDRVAAALIKVGATCNAPDEVRNTALHWAAYYGHEHMVRALLCSLARTDIVNRKGLTPLDEAKGKISATASVPPVPSRREAGRLPNHVAVAFLLDSANKGISETATSSQCTTPEDFLREAARQGRYHEVDALLQRGAKVNDQDSTGRAALSHAADNGNDVAVQVLLKGGADPSLPDNDGYTPLHWAAFYGHEYSIRILLAADADPTKKDKHSKLPADWARSLRHYTCAKLLEEGAMSKRVSQRRPPAIHRRAVSSVGGAQSGFGKVLSDSDSRTPSAMLQRSADTPLARK